MGRRQDLELEQTTFPILLEQEERGIDRENPYGTSPKRLSSASGLPRVERNVLLAYELCSKVKVAVKVSLFQVSCQYSVEILSCKREERHDCTAPYIIELPCPSHSTHELFTWEACQGY